MREPKFAEQSSEGSFSPLRTSGFTAHLCGCISQVPFRNEQIGGVE
jgi:hypothetical protein